MLLFLKILTAPPAAGALDWDALTSLVTSDDGKRELASLRGVLAEGLDKLDARAGGAKGVAAPNFDAFKADVDADVLAVLKKAYSDLKLPSLDAGASVQAVGERFAPLLQAAAALEKASAARLAELSQEVAALDASIAQISTATVDAELAADPRTAAKIDADIAAGNFY